MFLKRWFDGVVEAHSSDKSKSELVDAVLAGGFAVEMLQFDSVLTEPVVNEELLVAGSHLERIKIVKQYFTAEEFHNILANTDKYLQKSDKAAGLFVKNYEEIRGTDNKMALRNLNLASSFATKKSIGEIYRKRSALLLSLENWEDCLQDTELGLEMNCPRSIISGLNIQQLKCEILTTKPKPENPEIRAKHEFRDNIVFQLYKGVNDKMPAASRVVEVQYDEKRGRGLFVKEDVEPGATLIIEEPYVTNINEGLTWFINHCWRCLKIIQSTIPCEGCVFAVYCTEKCRSDDARLGHSYECHCLPYFHGCSLDSNFLLSFKTILKTGPEELYKLYKSSTLEEIQKTKGIDPGTGIYDSSSYLTLLNLVSHVENDGKLPELVWIAISLAEILDTKTDFFGQVDDKSDKAGFKDFVASVALYHILSIPFNSVALCEDVDRSFSSKVTAFKKYLNFAGCVYPVISQMNHGCDSSVDRVNLTNGKMAIFTTRALKAGDELLFCYGVDYATHNLKYRKKLLRSYIIDCLCVPCQFDWPLYVDLRNCQVWKIFRCPNCTNGCTYDAYECALTDLENGFGSCPLCLGQFSLQTLYEELETRSGILEKCRIYLENKIPIPVIQLMVEYIKFLQLRVCPPTYELCAAQWILSKAYNVVVNY